VYTTGDQQAAVTHFTRGANGNLEFSSCITTEPTTTGCEQLAGQTNSLAGSEQVVVAPDGNFVYAGASDAQAITWFTRQVAPSCTDGAASIPRDTQGQIALACTDANGDAISRSIVDGPAHGTLSEVDQGNAAVTYTPVPGYTGPDSFTFRATDGRDSSAPATETVNVLPLTCTDSSTPLRHDKPSTLSLSCTGSGLTRAIVTGPRHGTLSVVNQVAGSVVYTPARGYVGPDSLTFRASDATGTSRTATATLDIQPSPVIGKLSAKPKRFKAGKATTFSYGLSKPAKVAFTIDKAVGRTARFKRIARLVQPGKAGKNSKRFLRKRLARGSYRVSVVATDALGNVSKVKRAKFVVL
jgi:hypothetical protein